jgi:hypothetical protein
MSRRRQAEPRRFDFTRSFDGRDQPAEQIGLEVVQLGRPTLLVNDAQRSEERFKAISRPQLVRIEVLIILPRVHNLRVWRLIPNWRD